MEEVLATDRQLEKKVVYSYGEFKRKLEGHFTRPVIKDISALLDLNPREREALSADNLFLKLEEEKLISAEDVSPFIHKIENASLEDIRKNLASVRVILEDYQQQ